jgi:hypothetical protein
VDFENAIAAASATHQPQMLILWSMRP